MESKRSTTSYTPSINSSGLRISMIFGRLTCEHDRNCRCAFTAAASPEIGVSYRLQATEVLECDSDLALGRVRVLTVVQNTNLVLSCVLGQSQVACDLNFPGGFEIFFWRMVPETSSVAREG